MWKLWWLRSRRIVGWSTWSTTNTGIRREHLLSDDHPKRDTMSIEEATISNMWEIAATVELLEQKGLCTKQDLHTIIGELRKKKSRARIPETAFPEPYLLTETENKIIDNRLALLNKDHLEFLLARGGDRRILSICLFSSSDSFPFMHGGSPIINTYQHKEVL